MEWMNIEMEVDVNVLVAQSNDLYRIKWVVHTMSPSEPGISEEFVQGMYLINFYKKHVC
jgi:hypothetical protein